MTFHFHAYPLIRRQGGPHRVRLVARWRRGADGRLECRWQPRPLGPLAD